MMIDEHKFGSFTIDGKSYLGDIKILGSKVRYWETRKKHKLMFEDVRELLEENPEVIIIGTGNSGYLEVAPEIRDLILARRIHLFIEKNEHAVKRYNESLIQNKKVVGIFHATC